MARIDKEFKIGEIDVMKAIFKFYCDCGRMGELSGIFVAKKDDVAAAIGRAVYFGEVLGKHSDIGGMLEASEVTMITDDQEFVEKFEKLKCATGYNPLEYLSQ